MKNAIFLARILKELPDDFEKTNVDESNDDKKSSLGWLVRKMCKQAKLERANQPRITIKVCCCIIMPAYLKNLFITLLI